jgi:hypothetical protein
MDLLPSRFRVIITNGGWGFFPVILERKKKNHSYGFLLSDVKAWELFYVTTHH